jgi:hypothetical protein
MAGIRRYVHLSVPWPTLLPHEELERRRLTGSNLQCLTDFWKQEEVEAHSVMKESFAKNALGRGGVPPCWRGSSLQGNERKEDRRVPVEARRERWAGNVLKRKGIGIAVGVFRGNWFANRLAGRRSVGAKAQRGEPGNHRLR